MKSETRLVVIVFLILAVASCMQTENTLLAFRDSIETQAGDLRQSSAADASVIQQMTHAESWYLMFVPANGYNDEAAAREQLPSRAREEVAKQQQSWEGSAVIVYVTPSRTVTTRLPPSVNVDQQIVLKGQPCKCEIAVLLSRRGNAVHVSRVTSRVTP